jgi:16S rRNA G966 N2-methylase RsmD
MDADTKSPLQEGRSSAFHAASCSASLPVPFYDRDGITIYHGDSLEILPLLGRFDLLLTDPPYGVEFAGKSTKYTKPSGGYLGGDSEIGPEVVRMALNQCDRGVVFTGNKLLHDYPKPKDVGCVYCPGGAGTGPWGFICFHAVLYYGKRPGGPKSPSSLSGNHISEKNGHPCPKPIEWINWAMQMGSVEGELVVDPFGGSGTTARAAKDLGRRAIIIEKEEQYCEIAVARLAQDVLQFFPQNAIGEATPPEPR